MEKSQYLLEKDETNNQMKMINRNATVVMLTILLMSCSRTPMPCLKEKDHSWGKWKYDGRNVDGCKWLSRECTVCGWQQGAPSDRQ